MFSGQLGYYMFQLAHINRVGQGWGLTLILMGVRGMGMDGMGVTHMDRGSRGVTIEQRLKE